MKLPNEALYTMACRQLPGFYHKSGYHQSWWPNSQLLHLDAYLAIGFCDAGKAGSYLGALFGGGRGILDVHTRDGSRKRRGSIFPGRVQPNICK
jgi:hypothetical protein